MTRRIFVALIALCLFSCSKKDLSQPTDRTTDQLEEPNGKSLSPIVFSFQPDEPLTGYVVRMTVHDTIMNYAPFIKAGLDEIATHGGGTLVVPYGEYQITSKMLFERHTGTYDMNIVGERNSLGEFPLFYDRDQSRVPHQFITFLSNWVNPTMTFSVRNLRFEGNNSPYSSAHPFYGSGAEPAACLSGGNVASGRFVNIQISNIYGNGMEFGNGGVEGKNNRVENAEVVSCKIINCWSDNMQNTTGDGIMFWGCNNPTITNCIISNDVYTTNHYSRCGIVLENKSEGATIRNCHIEGYQKLIHIECDYGGHRIENNYLTRASRWGIVFVSNCDVETSGPSPNPTQIKNNTFINDQTYLEFGQDHRAFISMGKATFLDGSIILGNNFSFKEKGSNADRAKYINTIEAYNVYIQTHGQENILIQNNTFN